MIVTSKNFVLKLEEIIEELPTSLFTQSENIVLKLIRNWFSDKNSFTHFTSGSTGRPKKITISRDQIETSSNATISFLDPDKEFSNCLLCIDPGFIGGAMVVYRALIHGYDIRIVEPSSHPFEQLDENETFDLASMVPMQFQNLSESKINRLKTILIGGASISKSNFSTKSKVYATYGMTETVSHLALRPINESSYQTVGDWKIMSDTNGLLSVKGSITNNEWLATNDVVEIESANTFKWIGRNDFVINSGGIKIHPEQIEEQLKSEITIDFMVSSIPDDYLGNKLILLVSGPSKPLDFSGLEKYHQPKSVYFNQEIHRTSNGKIDRIKTMEVFDSTQ